MGHSLERIDEELRSIIPTYDDARERSAGYTRPWALHEAAVVLFMFPERGDEECVSLIRHQLQYLTDHGCLDLEEDEAVDCTLNCDECRFYYTGRRYEPMCGHPQNPSKELEDCPLDNLEED